MRTYKVIKAEVVRSSRGAKLRLFFDKRVPGVGKVALADPVRLRDMIDNYGRPAVYVLDDGTEIVAPYTGKFKILSDDEDRVYLEFYRFINCSQCPQFELNFCAVEEQIDEFLKEGKNDNF